jgi:hypothetical protein
MQGTTVSSVDLVYKWLAYFKRNFLHSQTHGARATTRNITTLRPSLFGAPVSLELLLRCFETIAPLLLLVTIVSFQATRTRALVP